MGTDKDVIKHYIQLLEDDGSYFQSSFRLARTSCSRFALKIITSCTLESPQQRRLTRSPETCWIGRILLRRPMLPSGPPGSSAYGRMNLAKEFQLRFVDRSLWFHDQTS